MGPLRLGYSFADAHGKVLVDSDHEISSKMDGMAIGLKACFVKKA